MIELLVIITIILISLLAFVIYLGYHIVKLSIELSLLIAELKLHSEKVNMLCKQGELGQEYLKLLILKADDINKILVQYTKNK